MTDEQNHLDDTNIDDATRSHEATPMQKPPRALPRRGYEGQQRPMSPPPPPPVQPAKRSPPTHKPAPPERMSSYRAPQPRAARPSRPARTSKSDSGLYLPWWSLLILVIAAGGCAVSLLVFVLENGAGLLPAQTPEVIVVTSPPRGGGSNPPIANDPDIQPPLPTLTATAAPNAIPSQTPFPGVTTGCPLNATVEVVGVGTAPLLIRSEPRQAENWVHQAVLGEQFRIIGGPQESADVNTGEAIEWCQLQGITTQSVTGWASREFLAIISE